MSSTEMIVAALAVVVIFAVKLWLVMKLRGGTK